MKTKQKNQQQKTLNSNTANTPVYYISSLE